MNFKNKTENIFSSFFSSFFPSESQIQGRKSKEDLSTWIKEG